MVVFSVSEGGGLLGCCLPLFCALVEQERLSVKGITSFLIAGEILQNTH